MWLLNIISFLILTVYISYKAKETMAEVFPVTTCGLIFLLYVMAYFRCLSFVDFFSMAIIGYTIFIFFRQDRRKKEEWVREVKKLLFHPVTLMILLTALVTSILVQGRIALWWDDINFWATDVKSIYYLDGFAGKYGNAAPEFGDYPPGVQLFKWWFLHFDPGQFREGLMFAGYYVLNIFLLAPLFSNMKKINNGCINLLQYFLGGICLLVLPGVVETFYLEGTCSDLPMGISYGLFLWSVIEEKKHNKWFSYWRQALCLSFVIIGKNTGFLWVIYGLIFWLSYHWFIYGEKGKRLIADFLKLVIWPVAVEGSWLLSCLLKRRVAKLTGAGIKMAVSGVLPKVDYKRELIKNFIQGFTIEPIHRQNTIGIDLSVAAYLFLAMVVLLFLAKKKMITEKERNLFFLFFGIVMVVSYGITLTAHLTIFATELQYLEAAVMTASIERYGVPFTMGILYILWKIWTTGKGREASRSYFPAMALIFLCTQWPGSYKAFIGYREEREQKQLERAAMVEEEAKIFAGKIKNIGREKGTRVLYLRDGNKNHWVKDTYINYEVSPVGVVYGDVTGALSDPTVCRQLLEQSHAGFLYADSTKIESKDFFGEQVENFCYETLYKVEKDHGTYRLLPVE